MISPAALVTAPLADELAPFLRRLDRRRRETECAIPAYRGLFAERPVVAAVVGEGARRARLAVDALLATYRPRRVLLVGVAGAISPDLAPGVVLHVGAVVDLTGGEPRWVVGSPDGGDPVAVSVPRIAATAAEKAALWDRLGRRPRCLVDLESAVVVEAARSAGASCDVIRAVSDGAAEDLPREILVAGDRHGRVRRSRVVAALLLRPWRLGVLLDLRRRVRRCAEGLAAEAGEWVAREDG